MAQNIDLWNAEYSAVPAVLLPKHGGGTARFDDTSDANATASDILSGKTAYVNGVKLTGTGSGGGSVTQDANGYIVLPSTGGGGSYTIPVGALRPDAELIKEYTDDYYLVEDKGVTIPAYTTTATQLLATEALSPTIVYDNTEYIIYIVHKGLITLEYTSSATNSARQVAWAMGAFNERSNILAGSYGNTTNNSISDGPTSKYRLLYYNTSGSLTDGQNTYGVYMSTFSVTGSSSGSNSTLTISKPSISIRGSTSYLNSTNWSAIDDVRVQNNFKVYRVPISSTPTGFILSSLFSTIYDYANGGELT